MTATTRQTRSLSELTHNKAIPAIAEHLVGVVINVLADEANAPIAEQELSSTNVL